MNRGRFAIVTAAAGHSTEHLDYTFSSFAEQNPGVPLHAFVLGRELPRSRLEGIHYHLVEPVPDFSESLREIYFRRMELIDRLDVDYALVVDSYDVLCLQPLPAFEQLVGEAALAATAEHLGGRYILGQGYTSSFINCGVVFWNVPASREMRREIVARGRARFRTVADDQFCLNEVIHTRYFDRVRLLPSQFNYRCHLAPVRQRTWPTVTHLDGVLIYHNLRCMDAAKALRPVKPRAALPEFTPADAVPLPPREIFWRRVRNRFVPHIVK